MGYLYTKRDNMIPAVILSTHTMGLAVIRSLGNFGIPLLALTYNMVDMGQVSKYVKRIVKMPHPENESDHFIAKLLRLGKSLNRSVLIPADDATVVTVSKNKKILEEYFTVACPDWETAKKFIIKKYTYQIAEAEGIPIPYTIFPDYVEEAKIYSKCVSYPCLVKPFESHKYFELFNRKMSIVNNPNDLVKQVESSLLNKLPVMLQEIIPGDETDGINYNSYRAEGKLIQDCYAQKVRLSCNGYGVPVVVKSIGTVPKVAGYTEKLLNNMDFNGFSCTEFKLDRRDNRFKLMEINGRHNRSALLAVESGINFPFIEYNHLVNNNLPAPVKYKTGIYWIDEFKDFEKFYDRIFKEKYKFMDFLEPYINPHVFAVGSINDPAPFIKRLGDAFKLFSIKSKRREKDKQYDFQP